VAKMRLVHISDKTESGIGREIEKNYALCKCRSKMKNIVSLHDGGPSRLGGNHKPSTAAITTRNNSVSVAFVKLYKKWIVQGRSWFT